MPHDERRTSLRDEGVEVDVVQTVSGHPVLGRGNPVELELNILLKDQNVRFFVPRTEEGEIRAATLTSEAGEQLENVIPAFASEAALHEKYPEASSPWVTNGFNLFPPLP